MWMTLLKYAVTVVVPGLIQLFGSKHLGAETATAISVTLAGAGARALHVQTPPAK
jgi:hypothetical protein